MSATQVVFAPKNVERYPRLDTILMVENAAYEAKGDKTVSQLWKSLDKKIMWKTFLLILNYLEKSNKIAVLPDRHVIWIWGPELIDDLKRRGLVVHPEPRQKRQRAVHRRENTTGLRRAQNGQARRTKATPLD